MSGIELSSKVRHVLSGRQIRCAVAFWGDGAADLLKGCSSEGALDVKIVCDISMGSTSPRELELLGAPNNDKLRFHDGLHAKVYISSKGAVVGSANASSNGIGLRHRDHARFTEAGTYYGPEEEPWDKAAQWFKKLYNGASQIDKHALSRAWDRWSPVVDASLSSVRVRPGSLLDLVRSNPDAFDSVGFVFVKGRNRPAVVERARENAAELYTGNEDIQTWSSGDMFTGWMEDVHRWPSSFIEFWMPRNQLSVFGRIMIFRELQTGTIFARRGCWRAIRNNIEIEVPTVTDISRNDAKVAKRMLKKHRNVLFSKPLDLWKALVKLESE